MEMAFVFKRAAKQSVVLEGIPVMDKDIVHGLFNAIPSVLLQCGEDTKR